VVDVEAEHSRAQSAAAADSLTTLFAQNNGFRGNSFDLEATSECLIVTGWDFNFRDEVGVTGDVSIYWREGTASGFESTATGWNLLGTGSVTTAGVDQPTHLDVGGLELPVAKVIGIYYYTETYPSPSTGYTTGGPTIFSNADLELITYRGIGTPKFGSSIFFPRQVNTTVYYEPCGQPRVELRLEPELDFNLIDTQHTLTATLTEGPNPVPGAEVTFEVFAGPNAADSGVETTDINGEAAFAYTGDGGVGVDEIEASFVDDRGDTAVSNVTLEFWDEDCQDPANDIPDTCDIDCAGFDGFCSEFAGCGGSADDDGNGVPDECILPLVVSYGVEGGLPHSATLNGTPVRPADAVVTSGVSTGELVFSAFPDVILEDIDALHVMQDGSVVFSTSTDVTQGFGGIPNIKNGDLVLWDGATATLLFSELIGFGSTLNNIDAFSILPNENWLLSTDLPALLGGLAFQNGDIVEYDPVADDASLYMGLDEATIFTGTPQSNADIDALHVTGDGVVFSIRSNGIGRIGDDLTYGWADVASTDLFLLDPISGHAELFLDGFRLFDGMTRNLDAVSLAPGGATEIPEPGGATEVPEPGRSLMLGFGIVGLLLIGRRRIQA
jgi:hypothetical protein